MSSGFEESAASAAQPYGGLTPGQPLAGGLVLGHNLTMCSGSMAGGLVLGHSLTMGEVQEEKNQNPD